MGRPRRGDDRRPKRERPVSSVKQQGNGGSKLSPEALSRIESALDSERRQREHLERRLRETEKRLEAALAAVQAPAATDAGLLQLKSQLVAEMEAAESRAQLEQELLALELIANAREEGLQQPAALLAPQRIIQYIHVPAPEVEAPVLEAPAPVAAPKDFDDKLAAAQMAIDAAEARASHNAVQVRKLTEELAAARAEQIRLSAEVRSLAERFGASMRPVSLSPIAAPEPAAAAEEPTASVDAPAALALAPLAEAPLAVDEPEPVESGDALVDLAAALSDWGAADEAPATAAEDEALLEDALSAFGDAPAMEPSPGSDEATGLDLEDALQAWGDDAPAVEAAESAPAQEPDAGSVEDSLAAVLEGWGDTAAETPAEIAPEVEEAADEYADLLEIDTLARLETPELPAEERLSEALGEELFGGVAETRADELLEDLESSVVEEEDNRWEPLSTPVEEDEVETIGAWSVLSPEDRLDEEALREEEETAEAVEAEPAEYVVETPMLEEEETIVPEPEVEEAPEPPTLKGRSYTVAALEEAEAQRQEVLAARDAKPAAPEPATADVEDFQPDLAALMKRSPAERKAPASTSKGGRDAMIDALQQFIGE